MEHRGLGRTKLTVSAVGLGTEFLIDRPREAVASVIHEAIDRGINYIDMFWAHPEFRNHMGDALRGRRDSVYITAHLGSALEKGQYAVSRDARICTDFFHDDLHRLNTDHVDVLFVHNCNAPSDYDRVTAAGGLLDLARSLVKQGKARFVGMSSHNVATALRAVEGGAIDVLMFPVNLASYAVPGKERLLAACKRHDVGLVAMKAFGGGSLLRDKSVIELQDYQMGRQEMPGAPSHYDSHVRITPVQCMAYVLDRTEVATVVPGCQTVGELEEALGCLTASSEERAYARILPAFAEFAQGECVYCNHCLPCPAEIDVGRLISLLELGKTDMTQEVISSYAKLVKTAADCVACGSCSKRCPFGVDVVSKMKEASSLFAR